VIVRRPEGMIWLGSATTVFGDGSVSSSLSSPWFVLPFLFGILILIWE
jgi:hypothetical protein